MSKLIFRAALLPSPKELWEPISTPTGINPSLIVGTISSHVNDAFDPCDLSIKMLKIYHCTFKLTNFNKR